MIKLNSIFVRDILRRCADAAASDCWCLCCSLLMLRQLLIMPLLPALLQLLMMPLLPALLKLLMMPLLPALLQLLMMPLLPALLHSSSWCLCCSLCSSSSWCLCCCSSCPTVLVLLLLVPPLILPGRARVAASRATSDTARQSPCCCSSCHLWYCPAEPVLLLLVPPLILPGRARVAASRATSDTARQSPCCFVCRPYCPHVSCCSLYVCCIMNVRCGILLAKMMMPFTACVVSVDARWTLTSLATTPPPSPPPLHQHSDQRMSKIGWKDISSCWPGDQLWLMIDASHI